jgi:phosphatidylethanolamine/phosphatidyl-N-methylethanolamine N-methyltransferase
MSNEKPLHTLMNGRLAFFKEFLKHPLQIGSLISSSRFLERHIVETAGVGSANTIVELGPGVGGTTRAILHAMAQHSNLLSIEINPHLHALVSLIKDDRLIAHRGDANGLKEIISMYGLGAPEVLISGIPFSTMSHRSGSQILEAISSVLAPGGRLVAYQLSKRVACLCQPFLGPGRMEVELFNIPPMRVYRWERN